MGTVDVQQGDADVVTSAPALDFGDTWSGGDDEQSQVEVLRLQLAQAHAELENARREARLHREGHHGALEALEAAKAQLSAERERAAACIRGGLDGVTIEDLLDALQRKIDAVYPAPMGQVASAAVLVCRDDAGDDSSQDASQGLR